MISEDKRFIDIQGILAMSDVRPADCIKINDLIIELSKENQKLKEDLHQASIGIQELIEQDIECPSNCSKLKELKKQLSTSAIFNEEDIRLDQTKEVFETLANILNTESCSYRYLIYDLLGFKEENYIDLIAGMSITNAIVELEELENQQKEFINYLESEIDRLEKTEFYIDSIQKAAIETHKHNLSKYKSIIGGKE